MDFEYGDNNIVDSEPVKKDRSRGDSRKKDYHKALSKRALARGFLNGNDWYPYIHQYSKGKIHCSCPICTGKIGGGRHKTAIFIDKIPPKRYDRVNDIREWEMKPENFVC